MTAALQAIADAVLYEGTSLYPYRRSSLKNRYPCLLGTLLPAGSRAAVEYHEPSRLQAQVLLSGAGAGAELEIRLRFLQFTAADVLDRSFRLRLPCPGAGLVERRCEAETEDATAPIDALLRASVEEIEPGLLRATVVAENRSDPARACTREEALPRAMGAAHLLLEARAAEFVSLVEPGAAFRAAAAGCENQGVFPILAGEKGAASAMLCAPIILYDYPQVAPQSPGDLFDGTEIDEILSLRILTLTDAEKSEALAGAARQLLQRTEGLTPGQFRRLHGELQASGETGGGEAEARRCEATDTRGAPLTRGSRVRLLPRPGGDIFDIALAGRTATVESVEEDFEGGIHLAVVVDDDPGRGFGEMRQIAHRFFFRCEEVEALATTAPAPESAT